MRCSDNNTAETVYHLFIKAVTEYGLPERVRSDQGGENRLVALHMIRYRGDDRRMIVGSSVHNQRIERLWRDLHRCVISVYYNIFYFLEYHGILEPTNEQHLFCLHYVYIPRINASLDTFANGWNNHGLRTERGYSPLQLFTSGVVREQSSSSPHDDNYGVEEIGLSGVDLNDDEDIVIPPIRFMIPDPGRNMAVLAASVDPLSDSSNFGIDLYQRTLSIIQSF